MTLIHPPETIAAPLTHPLLAGAYYSIDSMATTIEDWVAFYNNGSVVGGMP